MRLCTTLILCVLMLSCSSSVATLKGYRGLWSAYTIQSEVGTFHTTLGVRGVNVEVEIAYVGGKWYMINNGLLGAEIYPE